MLTPISTFHYMDEYFDQQSIDRQKVYMPGILLAFLSLVRLLGFPFQLIKNLQHVKRQVPESDERIAPRLKHRLQT